METGKRYLLHQMFSKPAAYALIGDLFPLGGVELTLCSKTPLS